MDCGRAVAVDNVIRGAWYKVLADGQEIGHGVGDKPEYQWATTQPMKLGQHISVESGICSGTGKEKVASTQSEKVEADPDPAKVPPLVPGQAYSDANGDQFVDVPQTLTKTSLGELGVLGGAQVDVFVGGGSLSPHKVGGTPSPGPRHKVRIDPLPAPSPPGSEVLQARQRLCLSYPEGRIPVKSCSQLPAATIGTPMPGDTVVQTLDYLPGSEILIFVTNPGRTPITSQIGDGGPPVINLTNPIRDGDQVNVVQKLGKCTSNLVYFVDATSSMDVLTQHLSLIHI